MEFGSPSVNLSGGHVGRLFTSLIRDSLGSNGSELRVDGSGKGERGGVGLDEAEAEVVEHVACMCCRFQCTLNSSATRISTAFNIEGRITADWYHWYELARFSLSSKTCQFQAELLHRALNDAEKSSNTFRLGGFT